MAKICNTFGSSPTLGSIYLGDHSEDYSIIRPDPSELFEDLTPVWGNTIWGDIQKMGNGNDLPISGTPDYGSFKSEIRNGDCMWSGQSQTELSTSATSTGSDLAVTCAVPLSAVTAKPTQLPAPIVVVANNNKHKMQAAQKPTQQQQYVRVKREVKLESSDDYEKQLQQHSIPNVRNATKSSQQQSSTQSMQHIPPGTSLLRKSNVPQQQQQKLQKHQQMQHKPSTLHLSGSSSSTPNNNKSNTLNNASSGVVAAFDIMAYELPETPPSLDDEATDFKQTNIDLGACMMGSNNISLNAGIIDNISKELQDTSKDKINIRLTSDHPDIHEVLDVIMRDEHKSIICTSKMAASYCDSDLDEDSPANSGYGSASSIPDSELSYGCTSPVSSQASSQTSTSQHATQVHCHSDHSYTRCKEGMDDLSSSAFTPSDSDEEIDVVSVSDKKLPTNPSDRDRRAIEHKVGYRFSTARIVKNPNGIRTIPPRRHGSYTLPCSPANSSPMKSVATSRYTSPSGTPYHTATYANKYMQKQGNILNADNRINAGVKSRKRPTVHGGSVSAHGADATRDLDYTFPPSKRNRGKKSSSSKHVGHHSELHNASDGDAMSRHLSLDENADTIEKRNLHNNMERQRRISLKKLFDELKVQIPNIMNKDRAPKVNILREATKLCESLTRENQHLCNMKDLLKEQMRKRQEHLARLRSLMRD